MTEEISSDPESKALADEGRGALQLAVKEGDGGDGAGGSGGDGGEERWKRERWTRNESMALVSAMKQLEEDANTSSSGGDAKWKSISQICSTKGVQRTSVQCRKRWNTLLAAYRKIKDWEGRNGLESYWSGLDFKNKKLPAGFDEEIWNVMNSFLAGRGGGASASPRLLPLKTDDTAAAATSSGAGPSGLQPPALPGPSQVLLAPIPQALPQGLTQQMAQLAAQPTATQPVAQPAAQAGSQPTPHAAVQPIYPAAGASPGDQTALPSQQGMQPFSQPQSERGKRERDGPTSAQRKRKRHGRAVEAPPITVPEPPKQPKIDEQAAGVRRCAIEGGGDTLTQFLSSFLEKSLESYERNSELNRSLRREQGEKLVAVLSSLSSAVRDLVQSSVIQK